MYPPIRADDPEFTLDSLLVAPRAAEAQRLNLIRAKIILAGAILRLMLHVGSKPALNNRRSLLDSDPRKVGYLHRCPCRGYFSRLILRSIVSAQYPSRYITSSSDLCVAVGVPQVR